ncbi:hypothetical protein SAMN05421805_115165 [Saccharopolyspora antimicrobica]|uniref:Uncharacterized protein n=1 Tax=Saccharopolyspora antimicrobica TaxID=455193 RepID=A0A1I5HJG6_9PSEU|nr:hypothetical protein [Saccharopolyspora antimicrobica]RKT85259.1 hypothetical protein ATL45_3597 [Saccharopolyspora antimicrobica]SFO48407.1 hypothetical protein SAMN05421805_115165 [Saccharopolyspora antimicrobica]
MRARKKFVAVALSLPVLVGLAACGQVQEAQQGLENANEQLQNAQESLDTANACLQALNVASFMPNFADPEQAKADAQAKVDELGQLAEKTADQTLRQNLLDVQQSVQQVAEGRIDLDASADWATAQLEKYQEVATTCSKVGG